MAKENDAGRLSKRNQKALDEMMSHDSNNLSYSVEVDISQLINHNIDSSIHYASVPNNSRLAELQSINLDSQHLRSSEYARDLQNIALMGSHEDSRGQNSSHCGGKKEGEVGSGKGLEGENEANGAENGAGKGKRNWRLELDGEFNKPPENPSERFGLSLTSKNFTEKAAGGGDKAKPRLIDCSVSDLESKKNSINFLKKSRVGGQEPQSEKVQEPKPQSKRRKESFTVLRNRSKSRMNEKIQLTSRRDKVASRGSNKHENEFGLQSGTPQGSKYSKINSKEGILGMEEDKAYKSIHGSDFLLDEDTTKLSLQKSKERFKQSMAKVIHPKNQDFQHPEKDLGRSEYSFDMGEGDGLRDSISSRDSYIEEGGRNKVDFGSNKNLKTVRRREVVLRHGGHMLDNKAMNSQKTEEREVYGAGRRPAPAGVQRIPKI